VRVGFFGWGWKRRGGVVKRVGEEQGEVKACGWAMNDSGVERLVGGRQQLGRRTFGC